MIRTPIKTARPRPITSRGNKIKEREGFATKILERADSGIEQPKEQKINVVQSERYQMHKDPRGFKATRVFSLCKILFMLFIVVVAIVIVFGDIARPDGVTMSQVSREGMIIDGDRMALVANRSLV